MAALALSALGARVDLLNEGQLLATRQAFAFVWLIVFVGAFLAFASRLNAIKLQEKLPSKTFVAFPDRRQCHAAMTFCAGNILTYAWGWLFLFMETTGGEMSVINGLFVFAVAGHVIAITGCISAYGHSCRIRCQRRSGS